MERRKCTKRKKRMIKTRKKKGREKKVERRKCNKRNERMIKKVSEEKKKGEWKENVNKRKKRMIKKKEEKRERKIERSK